jgi:hypothetical protein
MIYFLLGVLICNEATDCRWQRLGHYVTEDRCHQAGRDYVIAEEAAIRYRCVIQLTETKAR